MQHSNQVDVILSKWKVFKHAVPTNGAIILDESLKYVNLKKLIKNSKNH